MDQAPNQPTSMKMERGLGRQKGEWEQEKEKRHSGSTLKESWLEIMSSKEQSSDKREENKEEQKDERYKGFMDIQAEKVVVEIIRWRLRQGEWPLRRTSRHLR